MEIRTPASLHLPKRVPTKNAPDFTLPNKDAPKNAPDFILPNKDTPKTCPILDPNLRRRTFRGVCFCAPTRVHQKPDGFWTQTFGEEHLGAYAFAPLHGYVKNPAGFIFPHTDTPKTRPILDPNIWRGTFGGVCFCAPTRVHQKPDGFWTQTFGEDCFGAYAIRPYTGTCKI